MTSRRRVWRPLAFAMGLLSLPAGAWLCTASMPGRSLRDAPPALDEAQVDARARMADDLDVLAVQIGERHAGLPRAYERAATFLEDRLRDAGYEPRRETFEAGGQACHNLIAESPGERRGWVVVGAHYDTARGSPGADDNGSGVVSLLEIARRLHGDRAQLGLRLVLFANEEPPHFRTEEMGSRVHTRRAAEAGDSIAAMLSLETMGHYDDSDGSQNYPPPFSVFYPSRGNFLAFVGNVGSRSLVRSAVGRFRELALLPSEGAAIPGWIPGAGWSDHESFWLHGWPAVMVTDTAPFRYPHYHKDSDTPDKVDFDRLALATEGLVAVIRGLRSEG